MDSKEQRPKDIVDILAAATIVSGSKIARNAPDLASRIAITRGHLNPFADTHANVTGYLRLQDQKKEGTET